MGKSESDPNGSTSSKKDTAIKARIIKHMNTDHTESLCLYLRHYGKLSPTASASAKLVDMTYSSLIIDSFAIDGTSTGTHTIPIEPHMESWSDVRPRVVVMDREARTALDLPSLSSSTEGEDHSSSPSPALFSNASGADAGTKPVTVTTYDPPNAPLHFFVIFLVIWFYSGYFALRTGRLGPGDWYWENVMWWFPVRGAEGYRWLNIALAWPIVAIHGMEAAWMAWWLKGVGVTVGTWLWWMWVGSTMVEGGGALQRLSWVIERGGGRSYAARRRRKAS